jgi:hypothetical protein
MMEPLESLTRYFTVRYRIKPIQTKFLLPMMPDDLEAASGFRMPNEMRKTLANVLKLNSLQDRRRYE